MIITREYCDRCGKEVESSPLERKLVPIICRTVKYRICFSDRSDTIEKTRMVCDDCIKEFRNWWSKKDT